MRLLLFLAVLAVLAGCVEEAPDLAPAGSTETGTLVPWAVDLEAEGAFVVAFGNKLSYHVLLDSCNTFTLDLPAGTEHLSVRLDAPPVSTDGPGVALLGFVLSSPRREAHEGASASPIEIDKPDAGRWSILVVPDGVVANAKFTVRASATGSGADLPTLAPQITPFTC